MGLLLRCFEDNTVEGAALTADLLVLVGDPLPPCGVFPRELLNVASDRPHTRRDGSTHLGFNLLASLAKQVRIHLEGDRLLKCDASASPLILADSINSAGLRMDGTVPGARLNASRATSVWRRNMAAPMPPATASLR